MNVVKANLMMARRDWNRRGPHVPPWFRRRLRTVDPALTLQYMPPDSEEPEGVSAQLFPNGIWAVCRRLRRSRILMKRWVYGITGRKDDAYCHPTPHVLRLIRQARNACRRGGLDRLAEDIDRSASSLNAAASARDRQLWLERVASTCRRHEITKRKLGHVSIRNPGVPK